MRPGASVISLTDRDGPLWNRWTFQHVREMAPTAEIDRGEGRSPRRPWRLRISMGWSFTADGRRQTIAEFLGNGVTDTFLVLSEGRIASADQALRKPSRTFTVLTPMASTA
jgi:hypothetical protein